MRLRLPRRGFGSSGPRRRCAASVGGCEVGRRESESRRASRRPPRGRPCCLANSVRHEGCPGGGLRGCLPWSPLPPMGRGGGPECHVKAAAIAHWPPLAGVARCRSLWDRRRRVVPPALARGVRCSRGPQGGCGGPGDFSAGMVLVVLGGCVLFDRGGNLGGASAGGEELVMLREGLADSLSGAGDFSLQAG